LDGTVTYSTGILVSRWPRPFKQKGAFDESEDPRISNGSLVPRDDQAGSRLGEWTNGNASGSPLGSLARRTLPRTAHLGSPRMFRLGVKLFRNLGCSSAADSPRHPSAAVPRCRPLALACRGPRRPPCQWPKCRSVCTTSSAAGHAPAAAPLASESNPHLRSPGG
jgi:hypothetical protein